MEFETAIKEIRLKRQMSKYRLAKLSGLSAVYINQLEKNQKSPTERTLKKLATALDVDIMELIQSESEAKVNG